MKAATDGVKGMIYTPNEARQMFNKPPIPGGDTVFGQEQDHSVDWLKRRDALPIEPKPAPAQLPALPPVAPTKSLEGDGLSEIDIERESALQLKELLAV
jgi:hypothetical protein